MANSTLLALAVAAGLYLYYRKTHPEEPPIQTAMTAPTEATLAQVALGAK